MAKKMIHLLICGFEDEVQIHAFATHNERDKLLHEFNNAWKECGGEDEGRPFASMDLLQPMNANTRQMTLAFLLMGALSLKCGQMHIQFHSNF